MDPVNPNNPNQSSLINRQSTGTPFNKSNITTYLLILALSIHAFFEGIALGLQTKMSDIIYMVLAIALHKWVEALSIGINLRKSKIIKETVITLIISFSLMTPVGIVFGILFSGVSNVLEAIFLGISAGKIKDK